MRPISLLLFLMFHFVLQFDVFAHQNENDTENDEPKIAIVLSGGGAAGLAHIGLLKVLEELEFPIDIVTGTSMGSLIGALYAIGYTPDDMEMFLSDANWRVLFSDEIHRDHVPLEEKLLDANYLISLPADELSIHLPMGAIAGHKILQLFTRLTFPVHDQDDFSKLPRPFQAVATDLETGEVVVLDSGYLPLAMRASMSIPSAFNPVEIDGRLLVDGGLKRNLPVQNARELGADFIISMDASSDLKSRDKIRGFNDVLGQTVAIAIQPNMEEQAKLSDFHLAPNLEDFDISSFTEIKRLINLGEEEARKYYDELKIIADSLRSLKPSYSAPDPPDPGEPSFYLTGISIEGLDGIFEEVVRSALDLEQGWTTISDIENGLNNLQGMRYFDKAYYRIDTPSDTTNVTFYVNQKLSNTFNIGFRYDNWTKTSLLLNLRTKGAWLPFSTFRFTSKLGEELKFNVQYLTYSNTRPKFALYSNLEYQLMTFDIIEDNSRIATNETRFIGSEIMFGPLYSEGLMFATGYKWNLFQQETVVGSADLDMDWTQVHQVFAQIFMDSFNHKSFPTSGTKLLARTSWPVPFIDYALQYSHHMLDLKNYQQINDRNSLLLGFYGGQSFGTDIPIYQQFYLGTFDTFAGYRRHGLRGDGVLAATIGWQNNIYNSLYLTGKVNAGNTYPEILTPDVMDDIHYGWGLQIGWDSVIGPVSFSVMGNPDDPVFIELNAGFTF